MPRVMLERPNYFQKLVDLGCDPDILGTVAWSPTTRSVNVSGSVYLGDKGLTKLPFQFGNVGGDFWCSFNRLTSLEGCPREVGGSFRCSNNQLTSLKGCPKEVGRGFSCYDNKLTSLDGCPEKVNWGFGCSVDGLIDVSALGQCGMNSDIYLKGPKADRERVTTMLRAQGFKGEFICLK
jgi:hypothetical protein